MSKTVSVAAIKNGTVIDHIPSGSGLKILYLLKLLYSKHRISIGLNLTSPSKQHKDLIKMEDRFLTPKEIADIAIFAPLATINTIKNYKVAHKVKAGLPQTVDKILICPNPTCITNAEKITTRFSVEEHKDEVLLRCHFCEKIFNQDQIREYHT